LYASTLIAVWLVSLNISWDFDNLGMVMRKRGSLVVDVPSAGDQQVADICLTLVTSKPRSTNPSEMFSVGMLNVRCCITAYRLLGLGIEGEVWEVIALEGKGDG
jgi:hypothetical protein